MNAGILYALAAYLAWGLLPIYWKWLHGIPADQILAHRMVWSLIALIPILAIKKHWSWIASALRCRRTLLIFSSTAVIIGANWYTYIWAVNAGFIVETSLGYFINPLVSVLLSVLFLKESLRAGQWLAVSVAAAGVLYLTVSYGQLPWISLILAFTFGFYGLLKKVANFGALEGMSLETAVLFLPAFGYLLLQDYNGVGAFGHVSLTTHLLLVFTGLVTVMPLLWFAESARRIPLSLLGILQYLAPTLHLLIGVFVYHEPFDQTKLIGFMIIWLALVIYTLENFAQRRMTSTLPRL